MANTSLFTSASSKASKPNTTNKAGGTAYQLDAEAALAQYACTGTFNDTFYSTAETQLKEVLDLANKVSPEFLAKTAVYARRESFMKDMPAFLLAVLSTRDVELFKKTFPKVIDNGKMLRNFIQIMRSGAVGRKSLGSAPKKLIRQWLASRTDKQIFHDSVGNSPSMADIIKLVHPTPETHSREALYAYILGKKLTSEQEEALPQNVKDFEAFKKDVNVANGGIPDVPWQMISSLPLDERHWKVIAKHAKWMMTRMNLNTFNRHGVFNDPAMVKMIAERLSSEKEIKSAKAFPYQLLTAYLNSEGTVPVEISNALQQAVEVATQNVPTYNGKVYVMIDVSGSMHSPVTGYRVGATAKTSCVDVAALVAASVLRKNQNAEVILFHTKATKAKLNPFDSVMTNAQKIMKAPGGGTDCSAPMRMLNQQNAKGDLIIMVSDTESWAHPWYGNGNLQGEWNKFKKNNKDAKLVLIDVQANGTTQAKSSKDTLNVGGFSDRVFDVINAFVESDGTKTFWVDKINSIVL